MKQYLNSLHSGYWLVIDSSLFSISLDLRVNNYTDTCRLQSMWVEKS